MQLENEIETLYEIVRHNKEKHTIFKQLCNKLETENRIINKKTDICKKSSLILEYVINKKHADIINVFEDTISAALKDVFNEEYEIKFEIATHGNNCTVDFQIHTGEYPDEYYTPLDMCHGYSVHEIISVILRILIVKLDDNIDNILILDEPLSGLESGKQTIVAKFLQNICKRFGIQMILVTQSEHFSEYSDAIMEV